MLQSRWWSNWAVDAMTGGGRCHRRRKFMAGGRGTGEAKKVDANCNSPNFRPEITEKPSHSQEITKLPPASKVEPDLFAQACKTISLRSPFDSEDSQALPAFVSSVNSLPSGVSHLLNRQSDSRKRHKKLHSSSENKSSTPGKSRGKSFWVEIEEYFRGLTVEDIERLRRVSTVGFSSEEKCFLIPSLNNDETLCYRYDIINGMLARACEKHNLNMENGVELNTNGKLEQEENGPCFMDVDEVETKESEINQEISEEEKLDSEKVSTSFSGVEWLLGSRSKIYLASERPSKKRKLLGRDAGLEKLLVTCPVEGLESVCHYCNYGDTNDPSNVLIKCCSCGMAVHRRCYGVQEDVDSSWMCTWCKWKNAVGLSTETPCLLCPKQGGALKPVQKRGLESDDNKLKLEFAHLFCCQWMPEVYLENTTTMEPIMNMDELKDTRKKLICYLCKVKYGACVRCSNGSCRTSFHPICAREASHRMEIWGKLGSDEVELRAFCSKHSVVQCDNVCQNSADISLTANLPKLNDIVLDREVLIDNRNSESLPENGDALHPSATHSTDKNDDSDIEDFGALSFTMILKKLIDVGKVNAKDLASEIGVSADSLNTILIDNHLVPELQCKLLKWLKSHAHIGNLHKMLEVIIRSLLASKTMEDIAEHVGAVTVEDSSISDAVPVKSVPPRRRTKSSARTVIDDKSCHSKDKGNDETTEDDTDVVGEDPNDPPSEPLPDETMKILLDREHHQDNSTNNSNIIEDELRVLVHCLSEDSQVEERRQSQLTSPSLHVFTYGEVNQTSYIHPFIYSKLLQTKNDKFEKTAFCQSAVLRDREASQIEASSSSGLCCNNQNLQAKSSSWTSRCNGIDIKELVKAGNMHILKLSPADEVEGELIYYQQRLVHNAAARKRISDGLISKVVMSLPLEMDAAGQQKWDVVLVSQYIHDLREAKKQGRKERRRKEAQAVLAAATAAAAASSRISSIRKDTLEESSQHEDLLKMNAADRRPGFYSKLNPRAKETISRSAVARSSSDINSDSLQASSEYSKDHPRTCDICRRSETALNPILVCSSCKIAVHLDCYRSVKSAAGPWQCELCEDLFSSRGCGAPTANSWDKSYAECGLCGGTAGAFRKSVGGQWIHALCAEWVLDSTYRRGQINPIEGMDSICKGGDTCTVCRRKQGVCLKCSYGHCQTTFHPTCARSAGFYMTVRTNGGKLQHKAYCEKHSTEQRAKADTQKHGAEELKSLKQVRVELERLRLLCERLIRREKLKRELVLCSHDILASSRDSVLSALARHPFYQPEVSSESATTSIKGYTDGYKSSGEMMQRSDDISVDSTVAGKRRVKIPMSLDNDRRTDDSLTSQNVHHPLKPVQRVSFSGKQIPQRPSAALRNLSDDVDKQAKHRKQTETFGKELLMTSDQASMKNQRLPKGFVYVPVWCLSKDKESVPDACSQETVERKA